MTSANKSQSAVTRKRGRERQRNRRRRPAGRKEKKDSYFLFLFLLRNRFRPDRKRKNSQGHSFFLSPIPSVPQKKRVCPAVLSSVALAAHFYDDRRDFFFTPLPPSSSFPLKPSPENERQCQNGRKKKRKKFHRRRVRKRENCVGLSLFWCPLPSALPSLSPKRFVRAVICTQGQRKGGREEKHQYSLSLSVDASTEVFSGFKLRIGAMVVAAPMKLL